ncbi:MAG: site-specific DNA-methyltransferase [Candidatus Thermoplasmatota archaeon]|nr:site-specific DNA-methyltransferase [Candidatus Thermoplasmatota archaeon]
MQHSTSKHINAKDHYPVQLGEGRTIPKTCHKLYLGDCITVMRGFADELFDVVLVDPPYNTANKNTKELKGRKALSKDFGGWDYFADTEYLEFTNVWVSEIVRVLKTSGNFLLFCKLEYVSDIRRIYERYGLRHHATIIWHKTNPAPQIRKTGFLSSCEPILWAVKGYDEKKVPYTFHFKTQKEMHNFIETPICQGAERTAHPTQKPERVVRHLLEIFSNEGDTILDCFAGSGTTSAVAKQIGRHSVSIENDPTYFEIMKQRLRGVNKQLIKDHSIEVVE